MKKQRNQKLVQVKTLKDSSDDDADDITSTSSTSNGNDTDHSSKITNLMRENERKIRSLSESYMNRFLLIGQHLQSLPEISSNAPIPSANRTIGQRRPPETMPETIASLNLFIETLKQLIIKEEKKRGRNFFGNAFVLKFILFSGN
jgi:hypothetical protein